MKTLDEVIKALEYCLNPVDNFGNCNAECPYIHCCDPSNHDITEDALHYLKECQDMIKKLENCQKENQRLKKRVEKLESDAAWDTDYRRGQVQGMW